MKYIVGYLIQGEAAMWHFNLAKDIAERFNTWKLHEKIPPHITIYRPFDTENTKPVETLLSEWIAGNYKMGSLRMNDFGHFGERVIFAKITGDSFITERVPVLQQKIEKLKVSPVKDYPAEWVPHATLANFLEPADFKEIWRYISTLKKPDFVLPFDNLTLFRSKGSREWELDKFFPITS